MKQCSYKSYDELPLMMNVEMVAGLLGISVSGAYELMHEKVDQGGFAASVDANETDVIPRPHLKRYIGKEDPVGELLPHLYNIHDSHTFPYAV